LRDFVTALSLIKRLFIAMAARGDELVNFLVHLWLERAFFELAELIELNAGLLAIKVDGPIVFEILLSFH
jgi:hypothetical protein